MITGFVIMTRETLEAVLIIGIIMGFLVKTGLKGYFNQVYLGAAAGVAASAAGAFLFGRMAGGFEGKREELFEGITMLFGAFLLTSMIVWMANRKNVAEELQIQAGEKIARSRKAGIFFLTFVSILREGVESVIFLAAARMSSGKGALTGALLGLGVSLILGALLFIGMIKIRIGSFFKVTSALLILFAAGLVASGIHEFQESEIVPVVVEHLWDINPEPLPGGGYPPFHENGHVGSVLKGLFGYNGNPSLLEALGYASYLAGALFLWRKISRKKRSAKSGHGLRPPEGKISRERSSQISRILPEAPPQS